MMAGLAYMHVPVSILVLVGLAKDPSMLIPFIEKEMKEP